MEKVQTTWPVFHLCLVGRLINQILSIGNITDSIWTFLNLYEVHKTES